MSIGREDFARAKYRRTFERWLSEEMQRTGFTSSAARIAHKTAVTAIAVLTYSAFAAICGGFFFAAVTLLDVLR